MSANPTQMEQTVLIDLTYKDAIVRALTTKLNSWIGESWARLFLKDFYDELDSLMIKEIDIKGETRAKIVSKLSDITNDASGSLSTLLSANPTAAAGVKAGGKLISDILVLGAIILDYYHQTDLLIEQKKQLGEKLTSIQVLQIITQFYEETKGEKFDAKDLVETRNRLHELANELSGKVSELLYFRHICFLESPKLKQRGVCGEFNNFLIKLISTKLLERRCSVGTAIGRFLKAAFPEKKADASKSFEEYDDLFKCADKKGTPYDHESSRAFGIDKRIHPILGALLPHVNAYLDGIKVEENTRTRFYYYADIFYNADAIHIPSNPGDQFKFCINERLDREAFSATTGLCPPLLDIDIDGGAGGLPHIDEFRLRPMTEADFIVYPMHVLIIIKERISEILGTSQKQLRSSTTRQISHVPTTQFALGHADADIDSGDEKTATVKSLREKLNRIEAKRTEAEGLVAMYKIKQEKLKEKIQAQTTSIQQRPIAIQEEDQLEAARIISGQEALATGAQSVVVASNQSEDRAFEAVKKKSIRPLH